MRSENSNILHIVPALFRSEDGVVGGAERYALELARHMADAAPTTLVTFGDRASEERVDSLRIKVLGNAHYVRGQRTNPFTFSVIRELLSAKVIHCHQQHVVASSFAAAICRASGRKAFVSDLGGGGWDISGYVSTDHWYHGHLHISEYSRAQSGHAANPRAHIILGGVNTDRFSPDWKLYRTEGALFVGRLLPHKGVNYLIEGLPSGMRLVIAGKPYGEEFVRDLHALAHGKDVAFHHDFDDDSLVQRYRAATCIVLPSVYKDMYGGETRVPELLGQTLLEGMACGLPAICTSVASMPEIVIDGVTGFVVPPNDPQALHHKLEWLRDHAEAARRMGEAARQRVLEHFTWPMVVNRCLSIYEA